MTGSPDSALSSAFVLRAGTSIASSFTQGSSILAESAYETSALKMNAELTEKEMQSLLSQGDLEARKYLNSSKELSDEQYVQYAASGVDPNSGSAARVRAGTGIVGAYEEMMIKNNAYRQAFGLQTQKNNYLTQAKFRSLSAKNRANAGYVSGGVNAISDAYMASYYGSDRTSLEPSKIIGYPGRKAK